MLALQPTSKRDAGIRQIIWMKWAHTVLVLMTWEKRRNWAFTSSHRINARFPRAGRAGGRAGGGFATQWVRVYIIALCDEENPVIWVTNTDGCFVTVGDLSLVEKNYSEKVKPVYFFWCDVGRRWTWAAWICAPALNLSEFFCRGRMQLSSREELTCTFITRLSLTTADIDRAGDGWQGGPYRSFPLDTELL